MKPAIWDDFFEPAPISAASQTLDQMSFSDEGNLSATREWALGSSNNAANLPPISSPRRRNNIQMPPPTPPRGFLSQNQRASETKIARLYNMVTSILDRLNVLEEK